MILRLDPKFNRLVLGYSMLAHALAFFGENGRRALAFLSQGVVCECFRESLGSMYSFRAKNREECKALAFLFQRRSYSYAEQCRYKIVKLTTCERFRITAWR